MTTDISAQDATPERRTPRPLTLLEARVLGVLLEKQHTVPDTYPLSLNALTAGCNQKTARAPVMDASEADVLEAVDELKHLSLAIEVSGSRVPRFEHNINRVFGVPGQAAALLAVLCLRGPQTAAELRLNTARLHNFADSSSVEGFLEELAQRDPPLVAKLPRAPGERESRWMHLLCGDAVPAAGSAANHTPQASSAAASPSELDALRVEQRRLADEVARLQAMVERLATELGVAMDDDTANGSE